MLRIDPVPRLKNQFFRQGKTEKLFLHRASGSVLNMLYIIISHLVLRLNYCRYFFFRSQFPSLGIFANKKVGNRKN